MRNKVFLGVAMCIFVIALTPVIVAVGTGQIKQGRSYFSPFFAADNVELESSQGIVIAKDGNYTIGALTANGVTTAVFLFNFWEAPYFTPIARSVTSTSLYLTVDGPISSAAGYPQENRSAQSPFVKIDFNNQSVVDSLLAKQRNDGTFTWSLSNGGTYEISVNLNSSIIGLRNTLTVTVGPRTTMNVTSASLVMNTQMSGLKTSWIAGLPFIVVFAVGIGGSGLLILVVARVVSEVVRQSDSQRKDPIPE